MKTTKRRELIIRPFSDTVTIEIDVEGKPKSYRTFADWPETLAWMRACDTMPDGLRACTVTLADYTVYIA